MAGRASASFTATKPLTRVFENADGTTLRVPDEHRDRQRRPDREPARPPADQDQLDGRAAERRPGQQPVRRERASSRSTRSSSCSAGVATTPLCPAKQQLRPETCWTARSPSARRSPARSPSATWSHDRLATPPTRSGCPGSPPSRRPRSAPTADQAPYFTQAHPVRGRQRHRLPGVRRRHHAARGGRRRGLPAGRDRRLHRRRRHRARSQFEVRCDVENESLGCTDKVTCSIVVIPINGLSCDRPAEPATIADDACRKGGQFAPGLEQLRQRGRRPGGVAGTVVVGVQLAQPVLRSRSPSACRRTPATCSTRARRPASTAPSCSPRRRCSGRRRTASTRSGSSSSTTRCPTRRAGT